MIRLGEGLTNQLVSLGFDDLEQAEDTAAAHTLVLTGSKLRLLDEGSLYLGVIVLEDRHGLIQSIKGSLGFGDDLKKHNPK